MKRTILIAALTATAGLSVYADVPRPTTSPKPTGELLNMDIRLDRKATEAVLYIPKSQIKTLRAQLDELDGADNTAAIVNADSSRRLQTIVSGAFLSLAFVFGGIWFFRSGKGATRTGKSLVILAAVTGLASAATFVYANAGPASEARSITGKMFSPALHVYGFGYGKVRLATTDEKNVRLVVPNPDDKSGE